MPEHTSFLTLLLSYARENLAHNAEYLGDTFVKGQKPSWQSTEPIIAAVIVALALIVVGLVARTGFAKADERVVPEARLSLLTFVELFLGYFYDMAKSIIGPERAKKYFPLIATSACFVFLSNALAMVPGSPVPTTSLGVTLGCGLVVFVLFNLYGIKENGLAYIKHLAGPIPLMAPLMFVIETISLLVRPMTLAIRLMLNMAVDHLIVGIFAGLVAVLIPLPFMALGILVLIVQTLVFTMLTTVYIGLATEHEAH
ncbi:MAG TPA: F0F1 ATP synthase subunit A [Polyangiaceae bacterium]|nr:F0F1 ATP synthase subunit A [Polyangiaceae bacterium]